MWLGLSVSLSDKTSPIMWRLPLRARACFHPLECKIHSVIAEGDDFTGLARWGDVGHPEGIQFGLTRFGCGKCEGAAFSGNVDSGGL